LLIRHLSPVFLFSSLASFFIVSSPPVFPLFQTMQDVLLATPLIPAPPTPTPTPPAIPLLHRLPPELIDHLLEHIPPQLLQRTALSLAQVFPPDTISARYVWKHLVVGRPGQLMPLWMKLKEEVGKGERGGVRHVKTFCQVSESSKSSKSSKSSRSVPSGRKWGWGRSWVCWV
jgi:hypothetical protein